MTFIMLTANAIPRKNGRSVDSQIYQSGRQRKRLSSGEKNTVAKTSFSFIYKKKSTIETHKIRVKKAIVCFALTHISPSLVILSLLFVTVRHIEVVVEVEGQKHNIRVAVDNMVVLDMEKVRTRAFVLDNKRAGPVPARVFVVVVVGAHIVHKLVVVVAVVLAGLLAFVTEPRRPTLWLVRSCISPQ